jgi:hypothetical protein
MQYLKEDFLLLQLILRKIEEEMLEKLKNLLLIIKYSQKQYLKIDLIYSEKK